MTNSQFCVRQRQQEQRRLNKLLILGFAGSAVLHGILAYSLPRWSFEPPQTAEEPMELILVDKPKPQPKPQPKPKIESKPIVEPKPETVKPPEPVKAETPPPPVKPPEPVKAETPPPKPAPKPPEPEPVPKKVLTTPTPAPNQPIVSAPVENTPQPSPLSSNVTAPKSSETSSNRPSVPDSSVATNSEEASSESPEGISCVSNCEPEYPDALEGVEGSAGIKLTIDSNGNVVGVELANADSNSQINRQALLAARQMQFSSPGEDAASVRVKIDFTVEGSEYDRARREEQERKEQAAKEQQEIEAERQAQQKQLEQERQARQQQQEIESQPQSESETQSAPKPLPALSKPPFEGKQELEEERLRKFQERMENYR